MASVDVRLCVATALVLFPADEPIAAAGLYVGPAKELGDRLGFTDIAVQGTGRQAWAGRKGTLKLGERVLELDSVHGNEHELGVGAVGTSADALDALQELWSVLCEISGKPADTPLPRGHHLAYSTRATVVTSRPLFEIFPFLGDMRSRVLAAIKEDGGKLVEPANSPLFRVSIPVQVAIGGVHVARALAIEHRFTATEADPVLYTESPLSSDRHLALLEELLGP